MVSKSMFIVLGILSLLILTLPTGVVSRTAQAQSLGSDIANDVLFGEVSNAQVALPTTDQDQRAANPAEQRAANLNLEEVRIQPPPPTNDGELPPEEDVVFCFDRVATGETLCFDTPGECEIAEGLVGQAGGCKEFETPPPDARSCSIVQGKIDCPDG